MEVIAAHDDAPCRLVQLGTRGCAVLDVEDEVAGAVRTIAHEGAAGRQLGIDANAGDVDAVTLKALEIDPAEIVIADAAQQAAGLAEACRLIDENRRSTGWKRTDQRQGLAKAVAALGRHDLHQDLSDSDDLLHQRDPRAICLDTL